MVAAAVLSSAVVTGGWFMEHGLRISGPTSTQRAQLLDNVMRRIQRDYIDSLGVDSLYRKALDGLLLELHDPHSVFLGPDRLARLNESTSGRYAGVGIQMDLRDGWITVVAPLPGTPAQRAGIETGDRIVEIEGKSTRSWTSEEALKALRGEPGSTVRVLVERPGAGARLPFTLRREEIQVRSVQHPMLLRDGVGYVDLTVFGTESTPDLGRAIDSLRQAGMTSLVFDLRGNPGGLLEQGVGVADLFLDPGQTIVSMRGRTPQANHVFTDGTPQRWAGLPLVVLVDSGSASASEIVSGALQDHDRAALVGTTTYGKGSAQSLFPLGDSAALKLTTALWYTPSGRSIDRPRRPSEDDETAEDGDAEPLPTTKKPRPLYSTDAGRTVLGGGGVTPDIEVRTPALSAAETGFQRALGKDVPKFRDALTDYALSVKASHAVTSPDFVVTPAMRADLLREMERHGIVIDHPTYEAATPLVDRALAYQVERYVFGPEAEFRRRMQTDDDIALALELLRGARTEKEVLDRAAERAKRMPRDTTAR